MFDFKLKDSFPSEKNNIHIIKNYISKKECFEIISQYNSFPELNPDNEQRAMLLLKDEVFSKKYINNICSIVGYTFGLDVIDLANTHIRKWYPKEFQDPHSDCEAIFNYDNRFAKMTPINNFSSIFIEYAALLYLNDDYEGGEIYFPQYDLHIKPESGDLIFFPGTHRYMHRCLTNYCWK